ncbi:(2Fe-2S)-binding protein [Lutispora sp.]|jgi:carbon-monoxide dehydrogenase small subunit|uniref:(2Fe-2S)-binding protein n=1 Tax=Lutispora sp. TaxID=2828727 RepID=UPI003568087C
MKHSIKVNINGQLYLEEVETSMTLLQFIRDKVGLTGTKSGCENGECGACTVIMNGNPVRSCIILAVEADGAEIITVEGLGEKDKLHPLQQSFIETGAAQCGFCTPGMLMAGKALLDKKKNPSNEDITEALGGHLCRCTGYKSISKAVEVALSKNNRN